MRNLKLSNKNRNAGFSGKVYHTGKLSYSVEFEHDKYNFFNDTFSSISDANSYMSRICSKTKSNLDEDIKYSH
jgi:hypothetical protein